MSMNFEQIQQFIFREARLLDDRQWDEWLTCYHEDATYWMPCWDDEDTLTEDPQTELSLIYYPNRAGLEDRVYRIKTERSSASSMPEPRTTHLRTNIEILEQEGSTVKLRYNWQTNSHRYHKTQMFFGTAFLTLDTSGEQPVITEKKVILNNDYINQVIDIYHL
ncbi:benzoate 1,2-dioxygenase small subunit [Halopseudomonas pertucinogena]|uniref:Benzoate 1,2-dioxygenase small subunit n=1 Tax=Halopseudomonas pertucinogena TaxID=86175 RepID=A0ABQ2CR97_9GAMM|nr:benzoate 1,2-dioxygenase small subunit [Halopseudomonas pertucinogena]GGJ05126.1 benzoate 1,2-dioxygenase small subunit [Halopseudomonas pertucinogena]